MSVMRSPSLIGTFPGLAARRIGGDARHPQWEAELEALEDEVARLRGQLGETNERLDFAERLLTRGEEVRHKP